MNPSSNDQSVVVAAVVVLIIACGGQADPSSARAQSSNGGTSNSTPPPTNAGSVAASVTTPTDGGVQVNGSSSTTNSSAAQGGAFTVAPNGGSPGATTNAHAGWPNPSAAGAGHTDAQGGTKASVDATGFAGASAFAGVRMDSRGVPTLGGSSSTVTPGAGTSGRANAGGTTSGTADDRGNGLGGTASSTTRLSISNALSGIWLMGWSGGAEHYSWIRFGEYDATVGGQADFLDVTDSAAAWTSYLGCTGRGRWHLTARPETIEIRLPADCPNTRVFVSFKSIGPGSGLGMFDKATLQAEVTVDGLSASGDNPIRAFKYDDPQCDAAMTSCESPM